MTIHTVHHSPGGHVRCTCGWETPAPVFNTTNAQRFATRHLAEQARR